MGFSSHSVPSLSKVAIRAAGGTKAGPSAAVALETKSAMARLAAPSFHEASGSITSLPREHRLGLALQVDVGLTAHVDGDPMNGAAGKTMR